MYLSCLLINVGDNPDRPRPGRLWLRNRYRVHQRLCMAFPAASRRQDDRLFLKPYIPDEFAHVHAARTSQQAFLFRIDLHSASRVVILVQSALAPHWEYAFQNARHLLAAPPETKQFEPRFASGQLLRFRMDANPTKRLRKASLDTQGLETPEQWIGKRVPVPATKLEEWLARRAEPNGFRLHSIANMQAGYVYSNREPKAGAGQRLRSVRYEGVLNITDAERFSQVIIRGIGPAKAFGFGLLSVAPLA